MNDEYLKSPDHQAWLLEQERQLFHDIGLVCRIFFYGACFGVITTLLLLCQFGLN